MGPLPPAQTRMRRGRASPRRVIKGIIKHKTTPPPPLDRVRRAPLPPRRPRADGAGYEALMQAFSGIMSITGEPDGPPVRCGVSFLDLTTGILCAFGIVNALLARAKSGLGQRVDGSLLDTAVSLLNYHAEGYLLTGTIPQALGSSHPSLSPYRNFCFRDDQWIFIAGANDRFWQRLAPALGRPDLTADPAL